MKHLKKHAVAACALAAVCGVTALPLSSAALSTAAADTAVQKYEFENGKTSGGKIYDSGW